jgi:hypothetical protein
MMVAGPPDVAIVVGCLITIDASLSRRGIGQYISRHPFQNVQGNNPEAPLTGWSGV